MIYIYSEYKKGACFVDEYFNEDEFENTFMYKKTFNIDNVKVKKKSLKIYKDMNSLKKLLVDKKKIIFGGGFNSPVDWLPNGIEEITFSMLFNQPVDNLPTTLKRLHIIGGFDHDLNFLPDGLEELYLYCDWQGDVENLPRNLKKLEGRNIPKKWKRNIK